jgi:hypothetical protein
VVDSLESLFNDLAGLEAAKPTAFFHKMYVLGENQNAEPIGKFLWETMGDGKDGRTEGPDQSFDGR